MTWRTLSSGSAIAASRGKPSTADPRLVATAADGAYFQTEIAQRAAQIGLHVEQLALKQLAAGQ
jgi:hypothetical protein